MTKKARFMAYFKFWLMKKKTRNVNFKEVII